jgi:hypothetical protein
MADGNRDDISDTVDDLTENDDRVVKMCPDSTTWNWRDRGQRLLAWEIWWKWYTVIGRNNNLTEEQTQAIIDDVTNNGYAIFTTLSKNRELSYRDGVVTSMASFYECVSAYFRDKIHIAKEDDTLLVDIFSSMLAELSTAKVTPYLLSTIMGLEKKQRNNGITFVSAEKARQHAEHVYFAGNMTAALLKTISSIEVESCIENGTSIRGLRSFTFTRYAEELHHQLLQFPLYNDEALLLEVTPAGRGSVGQSGKKVIPLDDFQFSAPAVAIPTDAKLPRNMTNSMAVITKEAVQMHKRNNSGVSMVMDTLGVDDDNHVALAVNLRPSMNANSATANKNPVTAVMSVQSAPNMLLHKHNVKPKKSKSQKMKMSKKDSQLKKKKRKDGGLSWMKVKDPTEIAKIIEAQFNDPDDSKDEDSSPPNSIHNVKPQSRPESGKTPLSVKNLKKEAEAETRKRSDSNWTIGNVVSNPTKNRPPPPPNKPPIPLQPPSSPGVLPREELSLLSARSDSQSPRTNLMASARQSSAPVSAAPPPPPATPMCDLEILIFVRHYVHEAFTYVQNMDNAIKGMEPFLRNDRINAMRPEQINFLTIISRICYDNVEAQIYDSIEFMKILSEVSYHVVGNHLKKISEDSDAMIRDKCQSKGYNAAQVTEIRTLAHVITAIRMVIQLLLKRVRDHEDSSLTATVVNDAETAALEKVKTAVDQLKFHLRDRLTMFAGDEFIADLKKPPLVRQNTQRFVNRETVDDESAGHSSDIEETSTET